MFVLCLIILVALAVIFSTVHLCCHIENPSIVDMTRCMVHLTPKFSILTGETGGQPK